MVMNIKTLYSTLASIGFFILFLSLENCRCNARNNRAKPDPNSKLEQLEGTKNNFLLSPQFRDKKFEDIFTKDEIQQLNLVAQEPIFLEQDTDKNIYQIKVLNQKGLSCAYHAVKNCLWLMKAINSDLTKFKEYYFQMLSEQTYDKYQQSTGLLSGETYEAEIIDKIKNTQLGCLPEESREYVENVTSIEFSKNGTREFRQEFEKAAKKAISDVEHLDQNSLDKFAYEAMIVFYNFNVEVLYKLSLAFSNNTRFIHGFILSVWTCMDHGVCLIINKDRENVEYIFADSLNSNFKSGYSGRYLQAIEALKSLICQKDHFKEMLLRSIYTILQYCKPHRRKLILQTHIPKLTRFNLKECALYKNIYKKHFIDIIKKYKTEDEGEAELYDKILAEL